MIVVGTEKVFEFGILKVWPFRLLLRFKVLS